MALTLVRRATAELPRNTFLFRCDPKYTKLEIKEYLQKVYSVKVASVATINSLGKLRRSGMHGYKQSDYKKVYVRIAEDGAKAGAGTLA